MERVRVVDLPFPGLAHVFDPPGLPLVEKSAGAPPTTSVVVRGAAGTGKSTLALAVAVGIARASGGVVLYLVTEASLSDVAFKAELLQLSAPVEPFSPDASYEVGTILVAHLVLIQPEAATSPTHEIHRHALHMADELLLERANAAIPVRAIVIDGFAVPDSTTQGMLLRSEIIAFLQVLEHQGVSPVLVEEVGTGASDLLTFPVDVVLTLAFTPNPDTGRLSRQLVVSKSRYAHAAAGPHDAVLDGRKPAVWPATPQLDLGPSRIPLGFFMPLRAASRTVDILSTASSALILSRYDVDGGVIHAFKDIPGLILLRVECGPTTQLINNRGIVLRDVPASSGPDALSWALSEALRSEQPPNAVLFSRLEHLLLRPRFRAALPELLDKIVRNGLLVVVHGTTNGLNAIDDFADFTGPTGHHKVGDVITVQPRPYRAASSWLLPLCGIERPAGDNSGKKALIQAFAGASNELEAGDIAAAIKLIEGSLTAPGDALSARLRIDGALLLDRAGKTRTARELLRQLVPADPPTKVGPAFDDPLALAALGWSLAEVGDEGNAARVGVAGISRALPGGAIQQLWRGLWARFSRTPVPFEKLFVPIGRTPLLSGRLVAHAAAARNRMDFADALLESVATRGGLNAARRNRLLADVRLESPRETDWREAVARYEQLLGADDLASLERADVVFNLGVLHERFSESDEAAAKYRDALALNSFLEPASDRLASLEVGRPD